MTSVALIKTCLNVAHFSGLTRFFRSSLQGKGSILCFHHIVPNHVKQGEFAPNAKLEISPEFLESVIQFVRRSGFETVSLQEATERLKAPRSNQKPFVVFTLDDGYKDNLVYAKPIFAKYHCPYTVFVAPGIVDGSVELWWRGLEKIIAENVSVYAEIDGFIHNYPTRTTAEKNKAWAVLSVALQNTDEKSQRNIMRDIAKRYNLDLTAMCLSVAMTWEEIKELTDDPLCSIGAHTMGHFALAKLASEDAAQELQLSKEIISAKLGRQIIHFAYPYGSDVAAGQRDFRLAEEAGYMSSVTTRAGVLVDAHRAHLQALPRVMMSGRYSKLRYVDAMISGLPSFLINRFKIVNVD